MRMMMIVTMAAVAATAAVPSPAPVTIKFEIDQIFGSRPVVAATINGKAFRLVIHANAGSYLQINHAAAADVGARDLKHRGAYGIAAPGKVSDLGRDDGVVDRLVIGKWRSETAPVAVFEVPAGGSQGMLGLPWLHNNNVILDFARRVAVLPGDKPSTALAGDMRRRHYSPHMLTRDPADGRYLVKVSVNGVTRPMVVSTVAAIDLDADFARQAGVAVGAVSGRYGGPSGATGSVYDTAAPISFSIDGWRSKPAKVTIEDTYAYSNAPRPSDPALARGGELGADFMIANKAVIDFGNGILYLKDR